MEQSKSEILRDWIKSKFDNNYDYSTKENRTQDFTDFVNSHKEFNIKLDKPLYHAILKKEMLRKGFDPRTFGLTPLKPHFHKSDMKTTLILTPSQQPPIVPKIKKDEEGKDDGKTPQEAQEQPQEVNFTENSVGLTMKMMFNFLKMKYPFIESLTSEEQEALGQVWLPVFKKYLERNWAIVGVALFSTMSIMTTKIKKAKEDARKDTPKSTEV